MQVHESQVSASLLNSQSDRAAKGFDADDFQKALEGTAESAAKGGARETSAREVASTGLSSEVAGHLMQATQEVDETKYETKDIASSDDDFTSIAASQKNYIFDELISNPEFARDHARVIGTGWDLILIPTDVFEKYTVKGELPPGSFDLLNNNGQHPAQLVKNQRAELYQNEVAKGSSSLEIIDKILEFNANLPASYWAALDQIPVKSPAEHIAKAEKTLTEFREYINLTKANFIEAQQMNGTMAIHYHASSVDEPSADEAAVKPARSEAVQEFLDYMNKTPEERLFEKYLRELGLTKEQFEALPPEERMKVEAKIRQKVEEDVERGLANSVQTKNEEKKL